MNRLQAALLLCILQICQAHCFAEQAGLISEETRACCISENAAPPLPKPPCQVCDIVRDGAVTAWPVIKCAEPEWTHLVVLPIPSVAVCAFAETALSDIRMRPEAADPPAKVWAALICTAMPVRGPSVA